MSKPKGLFLLNRDAYERIYGPDERTAIETLVELYAPPQTAQSIQANPPILAQTELIFSGWGMVVMDAAFLAAAPNLQAVFYGAGSIKQIVTPAFWARGIPITSSYAANAVPVSEFTLSQIFFCLKRGWYYVRAIREAGSWVPRQPVPGAYGSTVGIISLGMIGQRVARLLQPFDLHVLAYDPFATPDEAEALQVELCSLEEIFERSDVVSLHTPWLKETEGMIGGKHFAAMKENATFLNTARGAIVRQEEMIEVLQNRPDLYAVLDVTYPEPPEAGSPLYALPNVVLTPHIAGSLDAECQRMGRLVVEELRRYLKGEPFQWAISQEQAQYMA